MNQKVLNIIAAICLIIIASIAIIKVIKNG